MPRKTAKPFDRSYWVVPGKLLAGCYPGSKDPEEASQKLHGLLDCGIRCVVNLMEGHETDHDGDGFANYEEPLRWMAKDRAIDIQLVQHPVPDTGVPSKEKMIEILNAVDNNINSGRPVYVHCWGGVGRTGTVVGCCLARHGIASGLNVVQTIKELRKNDPTARRDSPERGRQQRMVTLWVAGQ
jgi:hypothetical protein